MCKDLGGSTILLKQDFACANLDRFVDCQAHFSESTPDSFHNWISSMDLICSEKGNNAFYIGLFGSSMMLGLMVGSIAITNLSDIFGRKKVLQLSLAISNIALVLILLCQDSYALTILSTFVFGMVAASRYSVSFMYSVELSTSSNSEFFGALCLVGDSCSSVVIGFYFVFFKSFDVSLWTLLGLQVASMVVLQRQVPESPRYLFTKNKKTEFIEAI